MNYKLELIEDCGGIIYGAVIDHQGEAVCLATGFQHYLPEEIDEVIREVSEAEEFDCHTWDDCIPDPDESYRDLITGDHEIIYDGIYFYPERMSGSGRSACGYTSEGERKIGLNT